VLRPPVEPAVARHGVAVSSRGSGDGLRYADFCAARERLRKRLSVDSEAWRLLRTLDFPDAGDEPLEPHGHAWPSEEIRERAK
jgi:hypothetical protein